MQYIKRIFLQSALFLLLTGIMAACTDDIITIAPPEFVEDPGREIMVPVAVNVEDIVEITPGSRAENQVEVDFNVLEDERRLHDFWVVQYNSNGDRVGMPYYQEYNGQGENPVIPILIPTVEGNRFLTVLMANTGNDTLFNAANTVTLQALKAVQKPMRNADDVWNIIDEQKHLPMSGKTYVNINSLHLNVQLHPNVAKLHLIFKLEKLSDGEGTTGGSNSWDRKRKTLAVNWCNVPDLPYADIVFEADSYNTESARFPSSVNPARLNQFPVSTNQALMDSLIGYALNLSDKPMSFDVYLPRNTQGVVSENTDPYYKSTYASPNALYLEIINRKKEQLWYNKFRSLYFMPGANTVNDYNIIPGKFYVLDFSIRNFPTDDGVVHKFYRRYGEANAYIVPPNDTRIVNMFPTSPANNYATASKTANSNYNWEQTYYEIWQQELESDQGNGTLTQDPATWKSRDLWFTNTLATGSKIGLPFAILPSTEWVAEVIWQDRPQRLINFCDYLGALTNNGDYYESAGAMWLPVTLSELNNYKATFLYKGGTAFSELDPRAFKDPLNDRNPTRSSIFFKTTGAEGNVIVGIRKKSEGDKPLEQREYLWSWHLWITEYNPALTLTPGTMDRNIGAMSPDDPGFYYQFNRKDPFPHWNATVYDINGNELTQLRHRVGENETGPFVSMLRDRHYGKTTNEGKAKGVQFPFKMIYHKVNLTGTTALLRTYNNESANTWGLSTIVYNNDNQPCFSGKWDPADPTPQGWVIPKDEEATTSVPTPGAWTIATTWDNLSFPAGGLRRNTYNSADTTALFSAGYPFLWVKSFGTSNKVVLTEDKKNIAPNTTINNQPYYPIGYRLGVDALPIRCVSR